jgi:hypothetical protein
LVDGDLWQVAMWKILPSLLQNQLVVCLWVKVDIVQIIMLESRFVSISKCTLKPLVTNNNPFQIIYRPHKCSSMHMLLKINEAWVRNEPIT